MVNRLRQSSYSHRWAVSFGVGFFTWFMVVCFAKILPPSLQLLTMLIPVGCFSYALYVIPQWQKEGRSKELIESLVEREGAHKLMRQHHMNLLFIDREFEQTIAAMDEVYGINSESSEPIHSVPQAELPIPEQTNYLLKVQQEVMQACGDIGWSLVEYTSGRGTNYCDKDGWITVEKLRSNWAKNFGLNTDNLRQLLIALNNIQIGEWKDSSLSEWRLLLTR